MGELKQGMIIALNLDPQKGHEQAGYRPCLVISNEVYNNYTSLAIVCPITNTNRDIPIHVKLDDRTKTTGVIMCEQMKALDINSRGFKELEQLPKDILNEVLDICFGFIENI